MLLSILLPDLRGGGAERVMIDLGLEFAQSGHEVEFIVMRAVGDFLPEVKRHFAVVELAIPRARILPRKLARHLIGRRPDALLASMWPLTVIAPLTARMVGFSGQVLVIEHAVLSHQYATYGAFHSFALRLSTFVGYRLAATRVGVSLGTCSDMAALASMPVKEFVPVHNPIRASPRPSPSELRSANDLWGGSGPRILSVGSLKRVKNHSLLLRSFAGLRWSDARLMIVGRGEDDELLKGLARDLGVAERVIFAGFQADPAPFYATADLFALSSSHEGFGNVVVEALSFGLRIVSTDCPFGPSEILAGGQFGYLVPVGNAPAMTRAMEHALQSPVDREALIRRASDFAPEIAARKYLDLLGVA